MEIDTYTKNKGFATDEGMKFQIGLLTIFLLNGLQKLTKWKISTENVKAGKFDDVVIEMSDQSAILLQAKHRKNKRDITCTELFSKNLGNADFSLAKYFISYQEIKDKFKVKHIILCSNAKVHDNALQLLKPEKVVPESMLYFENSNYTCYTLTKEILPHLKEVAKSYQEENKNEIDKTAIDDMLTDFLNHFIICTKYPSGNKLDNIIAQLLSVFTKSDIFYGGISTYDIQNKVKSWYEQPRGEYLTEVHARAMVCEIRSDKYFKLLKDYKVYFKCNDFVYKGPRRLFHFICEDGYLLQAINIYGTFQNKNNNNKVLYVNPDIAGKAQDGLIEAFRLAYYTYLILIWTKNIQDIFVRDTCEKLEQILKICNNKKVILVSDGNAKLKQKVKSINENYEIFQGSLSFEDLSESTQERLIKEKSIDFQGQIVSVEELLTQSSVDRTSALNSKTLEKLIKNEKIKVGAQVSGLQEDISRYYIPRLFKKGARLVEAKNIYKVDEKMLLISEVAGMGKSTILTKLSMDIKEKYPHLWIIKIAISDYTKFLQDSLRNNKENVTIIDLLNSNNATKLTSHLERFIFSINDKVVLMVDGVDEVSPDYTELIVRLLLECQKKSNFAKIFVTTRPEVTPVLKTELKVDPFLLKPFNKENQEEFLANYWFYNLKLDHTNRERCVQYAKALISKMSYWVKLNRYMENHFAAVPLQAGMMAEIFQENNKSDLFAGWEGCREYVKGNHNIAKLPEKMDIKTLYDMFIAKKEEIFMVKGNPSGNIMARDAFIALFDVCRAYYRKLALQTLIDKRSCEFFLSYKYQWNPSVEINVLRLGIVQKVNNRFNFIHRTFAEYFVAESLVKELQSGNQTEAFQKFLIDNIIIRFEFGLICDFFDHFLVNVVDALPSNIFHNYQSHKHDISFSTLEFIHQLAKEGFTAIIKLILKCIQFKSYRDRQFGTLEFFTKERPDDVTLNMFNLLKFVVEWGGINITDQTKRTPLHEAAERGHLDTVKLFIDCGARLDMTNSLYQTALHLAASKGHLDIVKFLVQSGSNIHMKDDNKNTALHVAARSGYFNIVKYLVEVGIDINLRGQYGETALLSAARLGRCDVIRDFRELGGDIHMKAYNNCTLLHLAAEGGHINTVKYLLECGCDVSMKYGAGRTALDVAVKKGHLDIIKFLTDCSSDMTIVGK